MTELFLRVILPMGLAGTLCYVLLLPLRPLLNRMKAAWKRAALLACAALFLLPLPLLALLPAGQAGLAAVPTPVYQMGKTLAQVAKTPSSPQTMQTSEGARTDFPVRQSGIPVQNDSALPDITEMLAADPVAAEQEKEALGAPLAGLNLPQLAAILYWAGAAAALAAGALQYTRLMRRLNRSARPETDAETLALYAELCRELGVKRAPALLVCGGIQAPVLAGLWHSRLLLPEKHMQPQQLRFALRHELCHHKNADLMCKYLLLAVGVLHWYSPAAHLLRRGFAQASEQACDEAVTARLIFAQRKSYAATLLDFAGPAPKGPVTAFASPAKNLKTRLRRLMAPARPGRALRAACFALLCPLLALAVLAGCSLAAGASEGAAQSASVYTGEAQVGSASVASGSAPQVSSGEEASPQASLAAGAASAAQRAAQSAAIGAISEADTTASPEADANSQSGVSASGTGEEPPDIPDLKLGDVMPDYVGLRVNPVFHSSEVPDSFTVQYSLNPNLSEEESRLLWDAGIIAQQHPAAGEVLSAWPVTVTVSAMRIVDNGADDSRAEEIVLVMSYDPAYAEITDAIGPFVPVPSATAIGRGFVNNHRGLDIKAEAGAAIVAATGGMVQEAGWHYSYGNYVVIESDDGWQTLYAHCEALFVTQGDAVEAGDEIASVGNTGNTMGFQCHFEVSQDGELVDPLDFITVPEDLPGLPGTA